MSTNQRIIAVTFLAKKCDISEFWHLAAELLAAGCEPCEFDLSFLDERLTASQPR